MQPLRQLDPPWYGVDAPTMRALEAHEARVHASAGGRELIDLGDAIAVFDEDDRDPFYNRLSFAGRTSRQSSIAGSSRPLSSSRRATGIRISGSHQASTRRLIWVAGS